ncbi:MAG: T9SS type A sorting domain-containing protein [Ginsengibacter sp.]
MKKILMLALLLTAYTNIFAFLTQANWRWRNDDGTQTTATWKAAQNTAIVLSSRGEIFRLRLEIYNNTGGAVALLDTLQYATSTTGPWTDIDTLPGVNAFMIAKTSAFVVQDEPTTAQLPNPVALTFAPGKVMVDSMVLKNYSLADQRRTEVEWTLTGTANTAPSTTYYFREWGSTANPLDIGMTYPSLTTAAVLPIKLTSFTVSREDKKIRLQWVTASEQNNDHFEIQRSSDGRTWKTIANIKGHGTTTASNSYKTYDENPLNGINYYVIKQYDIDGHYHQSDVKSLRMTTGARSIISISPNPSHAGINFSLANENASNVEVTLTNLSGSVIHHEVIKNVQANAINKLNLQQQPTPGVYILKLKADGLLESAKVVIE